MPYEEVHVPAEILLEYKGYTVYYTYKNGQANDPSSNFYTMEADSGIEFDVRDLPNFGVKPGDEEYREAQYHTREYHMDVIREAIEHRHLDGHINDVDLYTLKEQEWTENWTDLQRWQLVEVAEAYSKYIQNTQEMGLTIGTLDRWYRAIFRAEKVGV